MGIRHPPAGARRCARGSVRAALAIVWLGWAVLASAQDRPPRRVEVNIVAGRDWAATGIKVRPGDRLAIAAGDSASLQGPTSPNGSADSATPDRVEPQLPFAALIGRVGDGPAFLVGARYEGKVTATGPLRLRWNLIHPLYPVITEAFTVEIRRTPAPVPHRDDDDDDDDADDGDGNSTKTGKKEVEGNASVEQPVGPIPPPPPPPPPPVPPEIPPRPPQPGTPGLLPAIGPWLPGLLILLPIAGVAALAVRRGARARRVARTRAQLRVSPSLDLGEGGSGGGSAGGGWDRPAEGPSASLRARLEDGAIRSVEGGEDG